MDLYGWKYEGRKISDKLHEQILVMIGILNDPEKVEGRKWPALQKIISSELGVATGQVRTIKRTMEEFGILKKGSLNANDVPDGKNIFTKSGITLIDLLATEELMRKKHDKESEEQIREIRNIYKLYYQKVLSNYTYVEDGKVLHPLRATLKALKKFEYLDYWEWYLLNTVIRQDDNKEEESELEECIINYRAGKLQFKESDLIENMLSHSYVLGNFEYSGLIRIVGTKEKLKITLNNDENEIIEEIIK
ncbi:hypothetical protein [Clostridium beijerinckii]|uniref:hypothetical protein n=1 Tax=Clostridium beijerinckii TaxID=1520 RepID=UPI00080A66A6|nr:hypothetical protein [Clostridium beijerinckii]OCA97840.1 hypothetical protein BGS1_02090 [Clostridium beijerinckii]